MSVNTTKIIQMNHSISGPNNIVATATVQISATGSTLDGFKSTSLISGLQTLTLNA